MPFIYYDPNTVLHPKKFINKVDVLYDGGEDGFSLANINWEEVDHIGIRWNVAIKEKENMEKKTGILRCHGSPALKGIPSWFILPRELFNPALFDRESTMFMYLIAKWGK
jgi:hypothetical protein